MSQQQQEDNRSSASACGGNMQTHWYAHLKAQKNCTLETESINSSTTTKDPNLSFTSSSEFFLSGLLAGIWITSSTLLYACPPRTTYSRRDMMNLSSSKTSAQSETRKPWISSKKGNCARNISGRDLDNVLPCTYSVLVTPDLKMFQKPGSATAVPMN